MEDDIYEAIAGWAKIPTWYTSHALDEGRFKEAMRNLVEECGTNIDRNEFENALRRHAKETLPLLGPGPQEKDIQRYTDWAMKFLKPL